MNQLVNMLRRRPAAAVTPPPVSRVVGLNSSDQGYAGANTYYVNLLSRLSPDMQTTTPPSADSWFDDGWNIIALPPGKEVNTKVFLSLSGDEVVKAGLHHILWDGGADATIALDSNMISSGPTKVAPGHWTFVMTQPPNADSSNHLYYSRTNGTSAAIAMPREAFVHDDHLALWQSRSWDCNVNPDFVGWAGPNIGRFRMAKISGTENSMVTDDPKAIVNDSFLFYGPAQVIHGEPYIAPPYPITTGMPYSHGARVCAKLGQADLHASIPVGTSDANIRTIGAQIASVSQYTGIIDVEVGNENWGGYRGPDGRSTFDWLNTTYLAQYNAAPYNANLQNGREAEAHAQMRARRMLIEGGLPPERVRLVYCSQFLGSSSGINLVTYAPTAYTLNYVDVGNVMGLGADKRFRDGLNVPGLGAIMMAPYNTPKATGAADVLFNVGYWAYDWLTMSDEDVKVFWDNGDQFIADQMPYVIAGILSAAPNAARLCYEWGQQLNGIAGGFGQAIQVNVNIADKTVLFNVDANQVSHIVRDGDRWMIDRNDTGAHETPDGLSPGRDVWMRRRNGNPNECYAYTTQAAAVYPYASDADAKAAAMVWSETANTAPFHWAPTQRIAECNVRMQDWLDGPYGAAMYAKFFQTTIGADKFQQACQLCDVGYSARVQNSGGSNAKAYGITGGIYKLQTARSSGYLGRTAFP